MPEPVKMPVHGQDGCANVNLIKSSPVHDLTSSSSSPSPSLPRRYAEEGEEGFCSRPENSSIG